jgi:hypothetical protein
MHDVSDQLYTVAVLCLSWCMGLLITGLALVELARMHQKARCMPEYVRSTDVLGAMTILAIGVIFVAVAIAATMEAVQ